MLSLYRELIAFRRRLGGDFGQLGSAPGTLAFRRGEHVVAVNTTGELRPAPSAGEPVLESEPGALHDGELAPHAAAVLAIG
jgi:hypothetical protein